MLIATKIKPDFSIENDLIKSLAKPLCLIAGIDEAGRGPLAGPVVAACVILNREDCDKNLNDSKKLSSKLRRAIFSDLQKSAKFGIGIIDEKIIDQVNILNATKLAMKAAFEDLCQKYQLSLDCAIVDGNFVPDINCDAKAIVKGDQKSLSIAAASIIAKETRDEIMRNLDEQFPIYNWKENKGYPTKSHYEAIKEFGASKYHRQSFTLFK